MKENDNKSNIWLPIGLGFVAASLLTIGFFYYKSIKERDPRRVEVNNLIKEAERLLKIGKKK